MFCGILMSIYHLATCYVPHTIDSIPYILCTTYSVYILYIYIHTIDSMHRILGANAGYLVFWGPIDSPLKLPLTSGGARRDPSLGLGPAGPSLCQGGAAQSFQKALKYEKYHRDRKKHQYDGPRLLLITIVPCTSYVLPNDIGNI